MCSLLKDTKTYYPNLFPALVNSLDNSKVTIETYRTNFLSPAGVIDFNLGMDNECDDSGTDDDGKTDSEGEIDSEDEDMGDSNKENDADYIPDMSTSTHYTIKGHEYLNSDYCSKINTSKGFD